MVLLHIIFMNHSFFRNGSELGEYPQIFLHCLRFLRYSMEKFSFGITVVGCYYPIFIQKTEHLKRNILKRSMKYFITFYDSE